jgi:DNA adenine methylase
MLNIIAPSPFLKWAGGKQSLARQLVGLFPKNFARYYEPFLGGGSVLFELAPNGATVGDRNQWLVDTYQAIRDDWQQVAKHLENMPNTKEYYLSIREKKQADLSNHERAANFIYLNKTCFRGLFRVNRSGKFNVPYGEYDRRYFDPDVLAAVAHFLQGVTLRCDDFEGVLEDVQSGDFVYLDPPYYKFGGYSDFNRYTDTQFREADHYRLADTCSHLDKVGVKWLMSNSDTEFVRNLYSGFMISSIENRREINLNSSSRKINELVISNYEIGDAKGASEGILSLAFA